MNSISSDGLARFISLQQPAIDAVTQRFYAEHGSIYERFGQAGRDACREDLAYHLQFLQPALEFGVLKPVVDYARWLSSVLTSRDIPADHVALSLQWLAEFFAANLDAKDAEIMSATVQAASDSLLNQGAFIAEIEPVAPDSWPESEHFMEQLLAGNQQGSRQVIDDAINSGHRLLDVEMHIVQPAMYEIGKKWQVNKISVAQEHLATAIARMVMTRGLMKSEPLPLNGRRVLLACVQGNEHVLGLQMLADAFQLDGWDVQFLGANVPSNALIGQISAWRPHLVGLSVSFVHQLRVLKTVIERIKLELGEQRPGLMVGGLAINRFDSLAALIGADIWSQDAASALARGSQLVDERTGIDRQEK